MNEDDYILIGYVFNKFFKLNVDRFKCAHCGFTTEGRNLIEFHIEFECKQKGVQSL